MRALGQEDPLAYAEAFVAQQRGIDQANTLRMEFETTRGGKGVAGYVYLYDRTKLWSQRKSERGTMRAAYNFETGKLVVLEDMNYTDGPYASILGFPAHRHELECVWPFFPDIQHF
jgi:hypothetical protein